MVDTKTAKWSIISCCFIGAWLRLRTPRSRAVAVDAREQAEVTGCLWAWWHIYMEKHFQKWQPKWFGACRGLYFASENKNRSEQVFKQEDMRN